MIKLLITFMIIAIMLSIFNLFSFRTEEKSLKVGAQQRNYFIHLPPNYSSKNQYPLVVMLHGYSDNPRLMEFYTGMSKKADKEGFIVVYPEGTNDKSDKNLSWNVGFCCGGAKRTNIDDVAFIDKLLNELQKQYSIDNRRIYVAGFSNGAMLTHKIGAELSSKISAIAAISGTIGGDSILLKKPNTPLPVFIMNGTKDNTIPFSGEKNNDGDTYVSATETVNFWKENNKSKDLVVLHKVEGGTHTWFGGKQQFLKNISGQSISATDKIWDFFKMYSY